MQDKNQYTEIDLNTQAYDQERVEAYNEMQRDVFVAFGLDTTGNIVPVPVEGHHVA